MRLPALSSRAPIGVDIGARHVKIAQFSGRRLVAAATVPRGASAGPLEAFEARAVADAIRTGPFRGKSVVLAVPEGRAFGGIVELPPRASGAPIEHLAKTELARRHGADIHSFEMACWDLPAPARAANRTYVMAVACAQSDSEQLIETVEAQGLSVVALDVHATAVSRACMPLLADAGHTGALLDIGWSAARLVLVYQGVVIYERGLPKCGTRSLAGQVAAQRHVELDVAENSLSQGTFNAADSHAAVQAFYECLASEMRIPLSYLASQYPDAPVKRVLLHGGGAGIDGLADLLGGRLDVSVQVVQPAQVAQCPASLVAKEFALGPAMVLSMGLALYPQR